MRPAMLAAAFLALLGPAAGWSQEKAPTPADFRRLLDGLPGQSEQQACAQILRLPATKANREDARKARASMRLLRERLPAIMARIETGKSILDYPGLLALGPILHAASDDGPGGTRRQAYSLHVGATLTEIKGLGEPTEFVVRFDEGGKILDVDDLVCRH